MSKIIDSQLSRRSFLGLFGIGAVTAGLGLAGCGGDADKGGAATGGDSGSASSDSLEKITMVWLPNESAADSTRAARSSAACCPSTPASRSSS